MDNVQLPDSVKELQRAVPPAIVDFLQQHKNVSLVFERDPQTNEIRVGIRKVYSQEVHEIVAESKRALAAAEKSGYSKEDAIKEFMEAQDEIAAQLKKNAR